MNLAVFSPIIALVALGLVVYLNRKRLLGDVAQRRAVRLGRAYAALQAKMKAKNVEWLFTGSHATLRDEGVNARIQKLYSLKDLEIHAAYSPSASYYDFKGRNRLKASYLRLLKRIVRRLRDCGTA